jgi:hypothetical protein
MQIFDQLKQQWVDLGESAAADPEPGLVPGKVPPAPGIIQKRNITTEYPTVDAMGRTIVRFPAALVLYLYSLVFPPSNIDIFYRPS